MTMQETFDKVYAYAQTMTLPASEEGVCRYRSVNGPCLIGLLITDEEAEKADGEDMPVDNAISWGVIKSLDTSEDFSVDFYAALQAAHDLNTGDDEATLDKEAMLEDLRGVAEAYGLTVNG